MTKFMLTFAILALGVAGAAPKAYHITLADHAWVGGNELKAGDYKVEIDGDKILIISGKKQIEVTGKVEQNARKFDTNSVVVADANSRPTVSEIDLGGTTTKILFTAAPTGE
jgi:hypothetical protein